MTVVSWIIVLFDVAIAVDAGRRPASDWAAADRRKAFWVTWLAIFGVIVVIPYAVGVLPRLIQARNESAASPFAKSGPGQFEKR